MRMSTIWCQTALAAAFCMFVVASTTESAEREPFEASYLLSDINETESEVSVQLTVSVTNHSGAEVHYGVLRVLRDAESEEPAEPYAQFEQISMPVAGDSLVFLVSEAARADDLNGDGDASDRVLHVSDYATESAANLRPASQGCLHGLGRGVFAGRRSDHLPEAPSFEGSEGGIWT